MRLVSKSTTLTRLLIVFPIIPLFLYLPLKLHSVHLGGMTCFFIAWLANFKLLLLAFNKGPLSHPSISLPQFIAFGSFPIKMHKSKPESTQFIKTKSDSTQLVKKTSNSIRPVKTIPISARFVKAFAYLIKIVLVAIFFKLYDYSDIVHPLLFRFIFILHIYLVLEIMLAVVAALARAILGLELEPQFNNPYLSTSLQDFWGRRWNLMVTRILRPTVYEPIHGLSTDLLGKKWASLSAVMATFMVSAMMHELVFYYLGRVRPTWEITCFFMIHGMCLVVEIVVKKWVNDRWRLSRAVSGPLTLAFILATAYWLFLPSLLRCKGDVRAFEEYKSVGNFVKDTGLTLTSMKYYII